MRRVHRLLLSALFVSFLHLLLMTSPASADTINVGVLSFGLFNGGAAGGPSKNTFAIGNFTGAPANGGWAAPPIAPVFTPLIFKDSLLVLTHEDGTVQRIDLGGIGPSLYGFFGTDPTGQLKFPETEKFRSAQFTATLSEDRFRLYDGRIFEPSALSFSSELTNLLTGSGTSWITVTGAISPVPLPAAWLLMGSGLAGLWLLGQARYASDRKTGAPGRN
ncbi:MAG: hypothetical protein HY282_14130 [Nitrospirae bacterium]|nr:hypothetical protein [Candidatus Manganitrophaceae bacterium]